MIVCCLQVNATLKARLFLLQQVVKVHDDKIKHSVILYQAGQSYQFLPIPDFIDTLHYCHPVAEQERVLRPTQPALLLIAENNNERINDTRNPKAQGKDKGQPERPADAFCKANCKWRKQNA